MDGLRDKSVNVRLTARERQIVDDWVGSRNISEVLRPVILRAARAGVSVDED